MCISGHTVKGLQDFAGCWGLSACCWQLTRCCLSPWMSSLSQVRPQVVMTHPKYHWSLAQTYGLLGWWFLVLPSVKNRRCWSPCISFCWLLWCQQAPIQGSSVQNPRVLRGLGLFFNISPVLIWVKGVSASLFIKKKYQTFCILPSSSWVIP